MPHFEEANGRKILYVDGRPFSVLAVEIPWWNLIYGRYKETEIAYDNLYPAAANLGLNALANRNGVNRGCNHHGDAFPCARE